MVKANPVCSLSAIGVEYIEHLQEKTETLTGEAALLRTTSEEKTRALEQLHQAHEDLKLEHEALVREMTALREKHKDLDDQNWSLRRAQDAAREWNAKIEVDNEKMGRDLDRLDDKNRELFRQNDWLVRKVEEYEKELTGSKGRKGETDLERR